MTRVVEESTPLLAQQENKVQSSFATTEEQESNGDNMFAYLSTNPRLRQSFGRSSIVMWSTSLRNIVKERPNINLAARLLEYAAVTSLRLGTDPSFDLYRTEENEGWIKKFSRKILISHFTAMVLNLACFVLPILTFIEPPAWCSGKGQTDGLTCSDYFRMKGPNEDGNIVHYYPNFGLPLISLKSTFIAESAAIFILVAYLSLRFGLERWRFIATRNNLRKIVITLMLILSQLFTYAFGADKNHPAPFLRVAAFGIFYSNTLNDLYLVILMLPSIMSVLSILLFVVVFYAWMGVVMFFGSEEGSEHFSDLTEAMWTLWICVTTANYPDVMMPAYNNDSITWLYFVSFMIISFFFLMNAILASVYASYTEQQEKFVENCNIKKEDALKQAFHELCDKETRLIDRETMYAVFLVLNEDCVEIPYIRAKDAELIFEVLDDDHSNSLDETEFLDLTEALFYKFESADSYKTFLAQYFPSFYDSDTFQKLSEFVTSRRLDTIIDFVIVLNIIVCLIQSWDLLQGTADAADFYSPSSLLNDGKIDTIWEYLESLFTLIYFVEMSTKIVILGWKKYCASPGNLYDGTITVTAILATLYVYYPNSYNNSNLIRLVMMSRVLRLLRLFNALPSFKLIIVTIEHVLPSIKKIFGMILFVMYIFSCIGGRLFGGLISRDPNNPVSSRLDGTDFEANEYWANNFNDMASGMNVLFNLLVVNNWPEEADGILAVTESKLSRFYFLAFHIIAVVIINNIIISSIIDSFLNELGEMKKYGKPTFDVKVKEIDYKDRKFLYRVQT